MTRRLLAWCRWEFSRRIEVTPVIIYLICERFFKAVLLVGGGIAILVAATHTDLHAFGDRARAELLLNPGQGLWRRLWEKTIANLAPHANALAIGAILYGLLEGTEGVGLLLRRRWAEYLVLIATVAFLPVEADELIKNFTIFKLLTIIVNIAIAAYLVWRKRLFLERPETAVSEAA